MTYPNIVFRRGKYFDIELDENISMKFRSLYPHHSSKNGKQF
uniref:Uncharacterized protein n=1 Tax=viral metagenome TaxID=1070528 RepID=A0A6C0KSR6_9ZZZZ